MPSLGVTALALLPFLHMPGLCSEDNMVISCARFRKIGSNNLVVFCIVFLQSYHHLIQTSFFTQPTIFLVSYFWSLIMHSATNCYVLIGSFVFPYHFMLLNLQNILMTICFYFPSYFSLTSQMSYCCFPVFLKLG